MDDEFYVTLYTSSDIADFSIVLHRCLNFPENEAWTVAVSEISLKTSFYNIQDDYIRIRNIKRRYYKVNIPDGIYPEFKDVKKAILRGRPKFAKHFTETSLMVRPGRSVRITKNLSNVLDLPRKIDNATEETLIFSPEIQSMTKHISVLCNFVEERITGNDVLPLLSSFLLGGNYLGGTATIEPYPLEYVGVKPGVYSEFRFKLQSTDGVQMKFRDNFLLINLKFARL